MNGFNCDLCNKFFDRADGAFQHIEKCHFDSPDNVYFQLNVRWSHQLRGLSRKQSNRRIIEYAKELERHLQS